MWKTNIAASVLCAGCAAIAYGDGVNVYTQTNLVSDLPGIAANQDTNLVNPWGIAASGGSPNWVSDNGTGLSTLYNGAGTPLGLVVTIPPATGQSPPADPTGVVSNSTAGFGGAHFIFGTESGTVAGWSSGANAVIEATGGAGSIYKGLAINPSGGLLYAANFGKGSIDVYNSDFSVNATLSSRFVDPTLPANYAPFNVQNLNGQLYVTYAKSTGTRDETDGPGLGLVDVYNLDGTFVKRLASPGGALNAPWGLALAPAGFGAFGGDLLVGNFGSGMIDAYNPNTDAFLGTLDDASGNPIVIPGLWGLLFGNGALGQNRESLYFAAGIPGPGGAVEDNGLYGSLDPIPEPGELALLCLGTLSLGTARLLRAVARKRR